MGDIPQCLFYPRKSTQRFSLDQAQTPRVTINARHERWCKGAQRPLRRTLDGMARSSETILTTSACYRGQRVGVAGQKPAAVGLFAVYGDPMTGQLRCFSAGARCYS